MEPRPRKKQLYFALRSLVLYGKPAHEGDSPSGLKNGTPPQEGYTAPLMRGTCHVPPSRGLFSLCIMITGKRTKIALSDKMMPMKVHVSSLHAPIYRNFYLWHAEKKKEFKHFDVERPVKVCALTGLSRAPPPKL